MPRPDTIIPVVNISLTYKCVFLILSQEKNLIKKIKEEGKVNNLIEESKKGVSRREFFKDVLGGF
jgi:hypothetical protein